MEKVKIETNISLPSGAIVTLTDHQKVQVEKAVADIVFGEEGSRRESSVSTRPYRRKRAKKSWRGSEVEQLKSYITGSPGIPLGVKARRFATSAGRTDKAVLAKIYRMQDRGELPKDLAQSQEPQRTSFLGRVQ